MAGILQIRHKHKTINQSKPRNSLTIFQKFCTISNLNERCSEFSISLLQFLHLLLNLALILLKLFEKRLIPHIRKKNPHY